jgi:DegV family protein with EDD domain
MKIITDSAADLTEQEAQRLHISVMPLYINFPQGQVSSNDLTADEFYLRLEGMQPEIPTTAQPSEGQFRQLYEQAGGEGEEILSIHISSGLSGTINAARLAAQHTTGRLVQVVDSLTLSGGERFQVLAAALLAQAGWTKAAILQRLDEIRLATEVVYTLETISYLARGGRIGRVQALAGALLKIKPIINVDAVDGKYNNVGRARTMQKALEDITELLARRYQDEAVWVSVMHGRYAEKAQELAALLQGRLNIGRLEILRISPVLGVHTGPGIVGAAVMPLRLAVENSQR